MKLKLNKKKLKNLSKDKQALPAEITRQVAGGRNGDETPLPTNLWRACMSTTC
ncbi:hypothetical protein [Thalassomonas sp. RHCl1]|uniref:hypothetical protein n=1 Tax=Thalassomonas sp. RHCl1 TaxID=2995320 RepID=UPI00248C6E66|nr:hypothetical protein [Thalassomonas sp. RHCl1]